MIYDMMRNQIENNRGTMSWPKGGASLKAVRLPGKKPVEIPILETNMLITGTTGYGKTVCTKEIVKKIYETDPKRHTLFYQMKPNDFTDAFRRPQDKVIAVCDDIDPSFNMFKWNMIKEIRSCPREKWEYEVEQIASILFSDIKEDKHLMLWAESAQNVFAGFVKTILYCYRDCPVNRSVINTMKNMSHIKLMEFLAQYKPNLAMLKNDFGYLSSKDKPFTLDRKGLDILFVLQNVLGKFKGTFLSDGQDTIHDYLAGHYGERLFIMHDHKYRDSSRIFERYFMQYLCNEMLSLSSAVKTKMLWILDEIDKIEYDFGLTQALTLGREFGLQIIVSIQSLESLYGIAPDRMGEHITNASLAGYGTHITFHPGDTFTRETMQKFYGDEMKETIVMPFSRYDQPIVKAEMRPKVENQDFAHLDTGEFYIKIRSADPVKVKLVLY